MKSRRSRIDRSFIDVEYMASMWCKCECLASPAGIVQGRLGTLRRLHFMMLDAFQEGLVSQLACVTLVAIARWSLVTCGIKPN